MADIDVTEPLKTSKPGARTLVLKDILKVTPDRYKERAESGRIRKMRRMVDNKTKDQIVLSQIYTAKDHAGKIKADPETHFQFIRQLERGKKLFNSKCKVSCSCFDFLFVDEVALFKKANADIFFSNGEDPVIKNPKMKPQFCKHLVKLVMEIRRQGW